jgi:hypothetical protein
MTDEGFTNAWFGRSWGAPINNDLPQVPTPVGVSCLHCEEPIEGGDSGHVMPYMGARPEELVCAIGDDGVLRPLERGVYIAQHLECFLRGTFGGVNHIEGRCFCCGGDEDPDPPGLTRREAARAAVYAWERKHGCSVLPEKS